jgi:hypothetical protein
VRRGTTGDGVDDRQEGDGKGGLGCNYDHEGRRCPREEDDDTAVCVGIAFLFVGSIN